MAENENLKLTDLGWALESKQPTRKDLLWIPEGTQEVHAWQNDEQGWLRIKPPLTFPCRELNHG